MVRSAGIVTRATGASGSHVCWFYDDPAAFPASAIDFLRDGAARGQRILYAADRVSTNALLEDLAPLGRVTERVEEGSLLVSTISDAYPAGRGFVPEEQVRTFRKLAADAASAGYTGLRVAADVTVLIAQLPETESWLRYEIAVDHLIATSPIAGMCGFHRSAVAGLSASLCAVHPLHNIDEQSELRVFYDGDLLRVAGEIDLTNHDLVTLALDTAISTATTPDVVLDLGALRFVDVAGLRRLAGTASALRSEGRSLRVVGSSPVVRRCAQFLGFTDLEAALD